MNQVGRNFHVPPIVINEDNEATCIVRSADATIAWGSIIVLVI